MNAQYSPLKCVNTAKRPLSTDSTPSPTVAKPKKVLKSESCIILNMAELNPELKGDDKLFDMTEDHFFTYG